MGCQIWSIVHFSVPNELGCVRNPRSAEQCKSCGYFTYKFWHFILGTWQDEMSASAEIQIKASFFSDFWSNYKDLIGEQVAE
ncbi:bromodomain associated family protein [Musa troglodytarum]|uniref:Bromodomain associated family protein n=1 Tax=Musa troglodytarum TaxID=320322 RepID=A0A9E7EIT4_9LILI|nr:bromodomain associated family protein [Musa troglodytarum]